MRNEIQMAGDTYQPIEIVDEGATSVKTSARSVFC